MVAVVDPVDIPTLDFVLCFVDDNRVERALQRNRVKSIVPLMFFTEEELAAGAVRWIGKVQARSITRALALIGLEQRRPNEPLSDFVERAFGGVGTISVAVLTLYFTARKRLMYDPLESVMGFYDEHPNACLLDLININPIELKEAASQTLRHGPLVLRDVALTLRRLKWFIEACGYNLDDDESVL